MKNELFTRTNIGFKERLNYSICLNILKTRKNPNIAFKIDITGYVFKYLKEKYQLNGRFMKCNSIFSDLDLDSENFYNENDSHSVKRETFQIRIMKKKSLVIKSKSMASKLIDAPYILSFKELYRNYMLNLAPYKK